MQKLLTSLFILLFALQAYGQLPKWYNCQKTETSLSIDGIPEKAWETAAWTDNFVDIEGDKKPLPRHRTRLKMMWDEEYFYFLAELEEPHIWATLKQRDTVIFYDNDFEIFIDPDGDTHLYYEFEMNAFNTVWDLLLVKPYRDGGPAIDSWDIQGLKTAVSIDGTINDPSDRDKKWTLEVAMPWEVLSECARPGRGPKAGEYWRANFSRVEWETTILDNKYQKTGKKEDNWVWSPQGAINMHMPEKWGIVFFNDPKKAKKFAYPKDEKLRRMLFDLFLKQRQAKAKGTKVSDMGQLWKISFPGQKMEFPFELHSSGGQFKISLKSPYSGKHLSINQQGRYVASMSKDFDD